MRRPGIIGSTLAGLALAACQGATGTDRQASSAGADQSPTTVATVDANAPIFGVPLGSPPTIAGRASWSGANSAIAVENLSVARDERGWQVMWQLVGSPPPAPLPAGAMAVGIFLDARPTGGFALDITGIGQTDGQVIVGYRETTPPASGAATTALTSPWLIQLLPAKDLPVRFVVQPINQPS